MKFICMTVNLSRWRVFLKTLFFKWEVSNQCLTCSNSPTLYCVLISQAEFQLLILCFQKRNLHSQLDCAMKEIHAKKFMKRRFSCSKYKQQRIKMSCISLIVFPKKHFFKDRMSPSCFKNDLNLNSFS